MVDFYPLDITHDVTDSGPIIILYGRSAGKKICVHYEGFEPYFYASFNESAKDQVQKTSIKEFQVTRIEPHAMSTGEQVFRVFVNVPRAVQAIKKELGDVIRAYEYDFPYERRFLIDHDITLGNKMTFEGEPVQSTNRIPTYLATTLSKCDTNDTYANPIALALDIETYLPKGQRLNMSEQPILMVGLQDREYKKVLTWKPVDHPDVEVLSSEADMLTRLSEIIVERDPDMVVGYNSDGFDMAYIAQRAKHYGLSLRMGVDNTPLKISGREYKRASIAGIVHIDLFQFVRRVMRTSLDTDTLSLDAVSSELLGVGKADVNILNLAADWDAGTNLGEYVKYNIIDIDITLRLFEKIYPNMIELVKVVGVSIFDACRSSFSVLVEWYLIKLAHAQNKLIPNKPGYNEQQRRMKEHVKGGFVFSPTPGLYEDVVVYDFRSLYPSIIASHNVSPETINCDCCENGEIDGVYGSYHFCKQRKGFISGAISELIKLRAVIKKELRTNKDDPLLNARSIALKLLANSMYGYLGFALARWYSIQSADATTAYGRKYVNDVIADAGKAGFHVV